MKRFALSVAALAAFVSAPALAQDAGATVLGNDGQAIGTVNSNDGTTVLLAVGEYELAIPTELFGTSDAGPTLNITRAQLVEMHEAQLAEAAAALEAALVEGTAVVTADPQALGTISSIDGENVIITRADESLVALPKTIFALDASGNLVALVLMADLEAALAAQGG
ncbi:MAG: hypothetical protein KDE15_05730 [Erythrobacter sp.]|nr:hypothetical protein [Erythrobacter sp.]